jgi:hypothetical protein
VARKRVRGERGDIVRIDESPDRCFLCVLAARGAIDAVGYFFGPFDVSADAFEPDLALLRPGRHVLIQKFFHTKVQSGEWPVIGRVAADDIPSWAVPPFLSYDSLTHRMYARHYPPGDFNNMDRQVLYFGDPDALPEDGTDGWMILLDHLRQAAGIDPKPVPEWVRMARGRELNAGLRPKGDLNEREQQDLGA